MFSAKLKNSVVYTYNTENNKLASRVMHLLLFNNIHMYVGMWTNTFEVENTNQIKISCSVTAAVRRNR